MASDAVYDAVKAHVVVGWTATPIAWENEHFERPEPPAPWVAVDFEGDLYAQASMGAPIQTENLWRERGTVWFRVHVPINTGGRLARQRARQLADLFKGVRLLGDKLRFGRTPIAPDEPDERDHKQWWALAVGVEFVFDS